MARGRHRLASLVQDMCLQPLDPEDYLDCRMPDIVIIPMPGGKRGFTTGFVMQHNVLQLLHQLGR